MSADKPFAVAVLAGLCHYSCLIDSIKIHRLKVGTTVITNIENKLSFESSI